MEILFRDKLNKKAQGMSVAIIVIIIIAIVVLVFLIVAFTRGGGSLMDNIKNFFGGSSNVDTIKNACSSACITNQEYAFCNQERNLILENKKSTEGACLDFASNNPSLGIASCDICSGTSSGCKVNGKTDGNCNGVVEETTAPAENINNEGGVLYLMSGGTSNVLSPEECRSGLEQRKKDLEIPNRLCYWEAMTQLYDEKCENLNRQQISEIFEKKAEYRRLNNSDWPNLNTDGDFCVPVIYDCDSWDKQIAGFMAKGLWDGQNISIRPDLALSKENVRDILLHEGLHSIQEKLMRNSHITGGSWNTASVFGMKEDEQISAKIIKENLPILLGLRNSFLNKSELKIDRIKSEIIDLKAVDQNNDGKFNQTDVDILSLKSEILYDKLEVIKDFEHNINLYYEMFSVMFSTQGISDYDNALKWFAPFETAPEYIEITNEEKNSLLSFKSLIYQSALSYNKQRTQDYLGSKLEIDPRLSEVNRWLLDKTAPNCEIITTPEKAREILNQFLETGQVGIYEQTQSELKVLILFYKDADKEQEIYDILANRLPGLAYNENNNENAEGMYA